MSRNDATGPVVVGVDGSKAAINAAFWAIDEAVSRDVPLRLMHVVEPKAEWIGHRDDVGSRSLSSEEVLNAADTAVKATGRSVRVETIDRPGNVETALVAESIGASMICVGSVGVGRVARRWLGSAAVGLATHAHCPVAVIRSVDDVLSNGDRIAVVVDAEPGNDAVVQYALEEARLRNAVLVALGVWRWDLGAMPYEELDQRLSAWRPRYPDVEVSLCAAHSGVVAYLADKDAHVGLVVIGDASADQVARLIGPHTHPLFAHPDCSALVVHPSRQWRGGPQWFGD